MKADPALVRKSRELRDRYLEHINTTPLLPAGKYDVGRALPGAAVTAGAPPAGAADAKHPPLLAHHRAA